MKKLGFGTMRLPMPDPKVQGQVNVELTCEMVDRFLQQGYTYFDTAYFYHDHQSECVVREALVKRHSRDSFLLADKLPISFLKNADEAKQEAVFNEQLEKCGVEYFDYYLLHCLTKDNYAVAQRLDTFNYLLGKKAEGKIRHLGFSFHDNAQLLDQILTEHPEVEFVQLQINYLDWEDERIQSRKCWEVARRHGKDVIVMEPVRGGKLAAVPEEVTGMMKAAHPDWSPASWAIRFCAGLDGVIMVLSGMSDMAQVEDNTSFMHDPAPLTAEELAIVEKAAEIISALPAVNCTACRYCEAACPRSIPIADLFALYNGDQAALRRGEAPDRATYAKLCEENASPTLCVECKGCEAACPQHLPIVNWLKRVQNTYK